MMGGFEKECANLYICASAGYDYEEEYFKAGQIGLETTIRCFAFGIKYVSEIYPKLTTRGAEAQDDKYVLFTIRFIPLLSTDVRAGS